MLIHWAFHTYAPDILVEYAPMILLLLLVSLLVMGFLDGINTSLREEQDLDSITETSEICLDIDLEKLFYNMLVAGADYLYSLPQWETILSEEKRLEIVKTYKRSKTVVKEKEPGRNDPCPCGSGKKYKKCCGKNA